MSPTNHAVPRSVIENIETVIQIEEAEDERRTFGERASDAIAGFVGSIAFVLIHAVIFILWMAANIRLLPVPAFDPYPFAFLCMFVSLEGVLLSTFVLIKQNRMSLRADRRSHLDLQINLLTEQEVTKLLQLVTQLAERLGTADSARDPELRELRARTAVGELASNLQRKLPEG